MRRWIGLLAYLSTSLIACDAISNTPRQEPVVVYVAHADEASLSELFAAFTDETAIPVTVRHGDATALVEDVIANRGSPPADVLLTTNVADIWRAADRGALRPIERGILDVVPDILKDPDELWFARNVRRAVIAAGKQRSETSPNNYAELADPLFRGNVCLVSSSLPLMRSLIAMLITEMGNRPAEILVRGWMQNLALPPFDSEEELLMAIRSGTCGLGILSHLQANGVVTSTPRSAYFDIDGVGIARHARYPDSAQLLVSWMVSQKRWKPPAGVVERRIGIAGWRDEDAQLLAERAGYE